MRDLSASAIGAAVGQSRATNDRDRITRSLAANGFQSSTTGGDVLNGQAGFRGAHLDLVGQLPLSQRFSLLGRVGAQYARTSTHFSGNRLVTAAHANPSEKKSGLKYGLGLEYKLSEALALRAEVERNRVNDAVGHWQPRHCSTSTGRRSSPKASVRSTRCSTSCRACIPK